MENKGEIRVIRRKILRNFCESHADSCDALYHGYRVSSQAEWLSLIDVQQIYTKPEVIGNFTVFNIKGNRYRLSVDLVDVSQKIYIKYVLSHTEYDKDKWKKYP